MEAAKQIEQEQKTPTELQAEALVYWFDHFNKFLFGGELDRNKVIIINSRQRGALGHFWGERWANPDLTVTERNCEISLNPDHMFGRSVKDIASTFVHEMCHMWQEYYGKPGRNGYHNKEWSNKMVSVGLKPYCIKTGKLSGPRCSHKIVEGEVFEQAFEEIPDQHKKPFMGIPAPKGAKNVGYPKFSCPKCKQVARAKDSAKLICGKCYAEHSEIVTMEIV